MLVNVFAKCSRRQHLLNVPCVTASVLKVASAGPLCRRFSHGGVWRALGGGESRAPLLGRGFRSFFHGSGRRERGDGPGRVVWSFFGAGLAACTGLYLVKRGPVSVSELSSLFESFNDWSYNRLIDQINRLSPPDDEPLLPDFEQLGYPENLPTLVLGFRGLICDVTHSRKNGWGIVKRPGVDKFLNVLKHYYEIVIWSDEASPVPHELIEKWNLPVIGILDKNHFSRTDGKPFKDLGSLGRNLSRVVLVDNESYSSSVQSDNSIVLPAFKGDPYDDELGSIIDLLKATALQPGDVREYLRRFRQGEASIGASFNEYKKAVSEKSQMRRRFSKFFIDKKS